MSSKSVLRPLSCYTEISSERSAGMMSRFLLNMEGHSGEDTPSNSTSGTDEGNSSTVSSPIALPPGEFGLRRGSEDVCDGTGTVASSSSWIVIPQAEAHAQRPLALPSSTTSLAIRRRSPRRIFAALTPRASSSPSPTPLLRAGGTGTAGARASASRPSTPGDANCSRSSRSSAGTAVSEIETGDAGSAGRDELDPALSAINNLTRELTDDRLLQAWPACQSAYIVREILQTERAYVAALDEIVKGYVVPLLSYFFTNCEGPHFLKTVFSNVSKIYQLHKKLLENLESTCYTPKQFAQVFLDTDFNLYAAYCKNYSDGNFCLDKILSATEDTELRKEIEKCQSKMGHAMPLHALLIKPVQRILKYRLLLEDLVKRLSPEQSSFETVKEALQVMSRVAERINSFNEQTSPKLKAKEIARKRSKEIEDLQVSRNIGATGTKGSRLRRTVSVHASTSTSSSTNCSRGNVRSLRSFFEAFTKDRGRRR